MEIIIAMLLQTPLSCPKIDCSGSDIVPHTHLLGSEQSPSSQPAVAARQLEGLADVRNLLQVERLILPSPTPLPIQNFCDLTITVMIQQCIDLGDYLRFRLANLSNWQGLVQNETSRSAA